MKKKILIILIIIIALVLLVPIPLRYKDGGSVEYKALLYSLTKYHKLNVDSSGEQSYSDGIGIEVLGMEIYNNLEDIKYDNEKLDTISIVTSLEDKIDENAAWCGTFNLIWNDLKNDLAKQDIKFEEQLDIVDNLNKGTFTTDQLSEDSYYKVYGIPTLELKKQIEKAIKDKFNETSKILNDFNWEAKSENDYFLYAMLKKEFQFPNIFTKLDNGTFGDYTNVKYFGIDSTTKEKVRNQVEVLYYNSEDDFAIKLKTKGNDEVIISVGNKEDTFLDIYNSIIKNKEDYKNGHNFRTGDILKIPNISFNLKKEITEVENKLFYFSNGEPYSIEKALQTIEFELDEKGGRIKSEAGMMVTKNSSAILEAPRNFIVDETFTIFLIEQEKDLPYFAAKISDISTVQDNVK